MANGLEIILGDAQVKSVFVNVFGGITACDAVANGIVQAFELLDSRGEPSTKPLVVRLDGNNAERGPADPHRRRPARSRAGGHDGRRRPPGRRAGCGAEGATDMAIFLNSDSKVIVQGMTGSEGRKHTPRMLASGTNIVGGVTPGKGGQAVEFDGASVPVFNSVGEAVEPRPAPNVTVIFVPAKFTKGAVVEADRGRDPAGRRHHRGRAGQGHRRVLHPVAGLEDPADRARTAPG